MRNNSFSVEQQESPPPFPQVKPCPVQCQYTQLGYTKYSVLCKRWHSYVGGVRYYCAPYY